MSNTQPHELRETYPIDDEYLKAVDGIAFRDDDFDAIRLECNKQNLPLRAFKIIVEESLKLSDFQRNRIGEVLTERQLLDAYSIIRDLSIKLHEAIESLPLGDCIPLEMGIFDCEHPDSSYTPGLIERVINAQQTIANLGNAANWALIRAKSEGADGKGRKKVTPKYAGHVATLACRLKPFGIVPGDNGPFRRICDVVWELAKVPAQPKGHIAYFIKNWRDDYKDRGYCL